MSDKVKKITRLAILMAAALIISYVENLIGLNVNFPGIKLGIANVFLTYIIYEYGFLTCFGFGLTRAVLSMVFTGRLASVFFSVTGIVFACIAMGLVKKSGKFSCLGVNVSGAVFHVIGQLVAAVFVMGTVGVLKLTPLYVLASTICGILTYIPLRVVLSVADRLGKKKNKEQK